LLEVEDVQVNSEKFDEMFGNFLPKN